ncbi:MAG: TolC family outer membrane protein [Micavibrio sp.]
MPVFRFYSIILAILFVCANAAYAGPEEDLTLQDVFTHVYLGNPVLQAAREGQRAAEEQYPQARAGWLPTVDAEANIIATDINTGNFSNGNGATTKGALISVEQPLFRGFRTTGEIERARQRIAAGDASLLQTEQDIFLKAATAYIDVVRDRQIFSLQQKSKDRYGAERESVQARFDAGVLTRTDVQQTEARYANALAEEAVAGAALKRSEAAFEEVTGIFPVSAMSVPVIGFSFPHTADEFLSLASAQNPELARTRFSHGAAREDITVAQSRYYPEVAAFASYAKDYDPQPGIVDETDISTIGLRARINLYEGGVTRSREREAKFRANQRLIEIRGAEIAVKRDLISHWRRYLAYDAEISARELEVTAARLSGEGVREEARIGDRTVLDTLEAEQDVLTAEKNLIEAKRGRFLSAYQLAAALGMLTAERLGVLTE